MIRPDGLPDRVAGMNQELELRMPTDNIGPTLQTGTPPNNRVIRSMANPARPGRARDTVRRGPGKQFVEGARFRITDEVRYIQRRAADHDGRIVTIGQLVLFSTNTGDAWLLDPADSLAARLARNGETEPIRIEETDINFSIDWPGSYRIEGPAFVYADRESGRVVTILGYPVDELTETTASVRAADPPVPLVRRHGKVRK